MGEIEEQRAKEELRKIRMDISTAKFHLYFEAAKTLLIFAGAVIVFWVIQKPESILNRESSKDSITRERAKLILEWIKEDDIDKREEALAVINAVYGTSENEWLKSVEFALKERARLKSVRDLLQRKRELEGEREKLVHSLIDEATGKTGRPGRGPAYAELKDRLDRLDAEIKALSDNADSLLTKSDI